MHETTFQTNYSEVFPTQPTEDTVVVLTDAFDAHLNATGRLRDGYDAIPNSDVVGGSSWDLHDAWTALDGSLAFLCDSDPFCVGFNSNGILKRRTSTAGRPFDAGVDITKADGVVFYLKKG